MGEKIIVRGARAHNLQNIDIDVPRNKLVVITGVSGSGKSSLAFDTIYAEGQRRYVESLSTYARQFLEQMQKPDVDSIEGLSPSIAIQQKTTTTSSRSTVGTITEIYDYLRLLYARAATPHCPKCGSLVQRTSPSQLVEELLDKPANTRVLVMAPVPSEQLTDLTQLFKNLSHEGFTRVRVNSEIYTLDSNYDFASGELSKVEIVIDRLTIKKGIRSRLADSLELAYRKGNGYIRLWFPDELREESYSEYLLCSSCDVLLPDFEPRLFSFNSPVGACSTCSGVGYEPYFDAELVVPNPTLSLNAGAILPWAKKRSQYAPLLESLASHYKVDLDQPWNELPTSFQEKLLDGTGDEAIEFSFDGDGQQYRHKRTFEGVLKYLDRRYKESAAETIKTQLAEFQSVRFCLDCKGSRIRPEARSALFYGVSLPEIVKMSIAEALSFFSSVDSSSKVIEPLLREIKSRLTFLYEVGLGYLSLERRSGTLSGGEAQRIRLATQIGSSLMGVLYVLDEPSIGLHPRDNHRLLRSIEKLRDLGNSVVVVEHDVETIRQADWLIDMGPGAGLLGGLVVAQGQPSEIPKFDKSITGKYLSGHRKVAPDSAPRTTKPGFSLRVEGASGHNLKHLDVEIPLGVFVCISGVSGSGKSTLINQTILPILQQRLHSAHVKPQPYKSISGIEYLTKVISIDQSPLGRTPRSNPATYTGLFSDIRELFAALPEAKMRGYKPGRFSFNVKGGRCEACQGDGVLKVEMHFLPDVYVPCEVCKGSRYNSETLEVKYKGYSIADVLNLNVEEALEIFKSIPAMERKLRRMREVGLGYLHLGQQATTLSGGESQRVKLAKELARVASGHTLYILDEPTTGLHFEDVRKLLVVLQSLIDKGNTVVVIEHDLEVIQSADWILDIGPEGGSGGGQLIAEGPPHAIANVKGSHTGRFLAERLRKEKNDKRSTK